MKNHDDSFSLFNYCCTFATKTQMMGTKVTPKEREDLISSYAVKFCKEKLDEEYAILCERMVKTLGKLPESPLTTSKPEQWAAAVVYAVGSLNFLYDPRFQPYIRSKEISEYFHVGHSTVVQKARMIRDILHLSIFWGSKEFSTQYILSRNPLQRFLLHFHL